MAKKHRAPKTLTLTGEKVAINEKPEVETETPETQPEKSGPAITKTRSKGTGPGWTVKAVTTKDGVLRHYNLYQNGTMVAGIARNSVLVLSRSAHAPEALDLLTKEVDAANINTCAEGTRFRGIGLEQIAKIFSFAPPSDLPQFAPRASRDTTKGVPTEPAKTVKIEL